MEESRVAFVITLLSCRAALWGTAFWEQKHLCCSLFQTFSDELKKVFDQAVSPEKWREFWRTCGKVTDQLRITPLNFAH